MSVARCTRLSAGVWHVSGTMASSYPFTFDSYHPYPATNPPLLAGGSLFSSNRSTPGPSRPRLPPLLSSTFRQPFMPSLHDDGGSARAVPPPMTGDPAFDILDWLPAYQSCQRYFLDYAQHEQATQALCALINIRLPFQHSTHPITTSSRHAPGSTTHTTSSTTTTNNSTSNGNSADFNFSYPRPNGTNTANHQSSNPPPPISLLPYLRRLVATNFDKPPILHGFFGDDYERGVLPHLDCERRNYLFAARSGGWEACKRLCDAGTGDAGDESVPFLRPLGRVVDEEVRAAEKAWAEWREGMEWTVGAGKGKEREEEVGVAVGGVREAVDDAGGFGENVGEGQVRAANGDILPDEVSGAFGGEEDKIG